MNWVDVLVIVLVGLLSIALASYFIYKKHKGEPIESCACKGVGKQLVDAYHAEKKKEMASSGEDKK